MPADGPRSSHSPRAERLVLSLGLASSVAMVLAALQLELRPDWVGEFALDDATRRVSAGVAEEWRQLVREPERWIDFGRDPIRWPLEAERAVERPTPSAAEAPAVNLAAFDALLDQAEHREVAEGDLEGARETALAALEQPGDAGRRARGRLRVLQLARKLGDDQEALAQWRALRGEATGREEDGGVSCLLLGALAIAPLLVEEERAELHEALVSRWAAGALALPVGAAAGRDGEGRLLVEVPVEIEVMAHEVQALVPGAADERLARAFEQERARALEMHFGELPRAPVDGSLGLRFLDEDVLAYRAGQQSGYEGTLLTTDGLIEALEAHLRSLPFFPTGFRVDLRGDDEELGVAVGLPTPLWGEHLGYTLRHTDPEGFMRGEERRLGILQVSLLGMAAFTLLAGLVSFQALRRQRVLHELKGRFVASVSHELRTPVTGILLATENLCAGRARTPERLERYHLLIDKEARRLRRLVDDVLDFSRLDRGAEARMHLEGVALDSFVSELVSECRQRVEQAGLTFEAAVQLDVEEARLDAEAIRRAVANLTENAVQHSGSERIGLSVAAGDELVIGVEDEGRGIPARLRKTIFEPFRQVAGPDGSAEGAARGTGLGLAIVREICRAHGGSVRCVAPASGGTRFELSLPVRSPAVEGEADS